MKIIIKNNENINIINKSKFIGIIKKVLSKDEAIKELQKTKNEYPDATHIAYAYILPNTIKYSDDGEPDGTAGLPILEILKKNDLCYVIAIVVRYFGGIKLGSNGLIRAYSNSISSLISENIKEKEIGYLISIETTYNNNDLINYELRDSTIIKKEYLDRIYIEAIVNKKTLDNLSNVPYRIIEEKII